MMDDETSEEAAAPVTLSPPIWMYSIVITDCVLEITGLPH